MPPSSEKACTMLRDGTANGQPLSGAQKRYFGLLCSGGTPTKAADGSIVSVPSPNYEANTNFALLECLGEDPHFLEKFP